jgi:hypothetical protein
VGGWGGGATKSGFLFKIIVTVCNDAVLWYFFTITSPSKDKKLCESVSVSVYIVFI